MKTCEKNNEIIFLIVCDKNKKDVCGINQLRNKKINNKLCELEGQTIDVYIISDCKLMLNELELNTEIAIKQRSFTKRGNLLFNCDTKRL